MQTTHTTEFRAILALTGIMMARLLGLFMILPVFSLYASTLPGGTATMVGLAMGVYGLTQACCQVPFGTLSDRWGRKPVIALGLCIFIIGGIVAAYAHSLTGIVIGRALQGAAAISSALLATVADLTRDETRSRAMAVIGMGIGFSFSLAMVLGPAFVPTVGLTGLFKISALLGGIALLILAFGVPTPPRLSVHHEAMPYALLWKTDLWRLDVAVFTLHAILVSVFFAAPLFLSRVLHLSPHQQTLFYLVSLSLAFLCVFPLIMMAEKRRCLKMVLKLSMWILPIAPALLFTLPLHLTLACLIWFLFFTAFSFLEASLPSVLSKRVPVQHKGTAMGFYSTSQFIGIFLGGTLSGACYHAGGFWGISFLLLALGLVGILATLALKEPPYFSTFIFKLGEQANADIAHRLRRVPGIGDIWIAENEGVLYVKADKKIIPESQLRNVLNESNLIAL